MSINNEGTEKLNAVLNHLDSTLADEIFGFFYLQNTLEFARYLHSLENVTDTVKRDLLALKVSQKLPYKGAGLDVLIEKAARQQWLHLVELASKAENQ